MKENEHLDEDQIKKKRCCEQSFLGSVVGMQNEEKQEVGSFRKAIGLLLLIGVHMHLLIWSWFASLFSPRFKKVVKFQKLYFKDVLAKELSGEKAPESQ